MPAQTGDLCIQCLRRCFQNADQRTEKTAGFRLRPPVNGRQLLHQGVSGIEHRELGNSRDGGAGRGDQGDADPQVPPAHIEDRRGDRTGLIRLHARAAVEGKRLPFSEEIAQPPDPLADGIVVSAKRRCASAPAWASSVDAWEISIVQPGGNLTIASTRSQRRSASVAVDRSIGVMSSALTSEASLETDWLAANSWRPCAVVTARRVRSAATLVAASFSTNSFSGLPSASRVKTRLRPPKGAPSVPAGARRVHPSLPITATVKQGRTAETGMVKLARPPPRPNQ